MARRWDFHAADGLRSRRVCGEHMSGYFTDTATRRRAASLEPLKAKTKGQRVVALQKDRKG